MKAAKLTPGSAPAKEMVLHVSGLSFSETMSPANFRRPAHRHEQAAMNCVPAGGYSKTVGCRKRECKPLTSVFHPQAESHAVVFHRAEVRIFRVRP